MMDLTSWSTREKLAIVSFITRLGDNEWVDADKFLETFCEVGQHSNWLAATSCAHQIKDFLEQHVDERQDSSTNHGNILENVTKARLAELEQLISKEHDDFARMRDELDMIESGSLDNKLDELLEKISSSADKKEADPSQNGTDVDSQPREYSLSNMLHSPAVTRRVNETHLTPTGAAKLPCGITHISGENVTPNESSKPSYGHEVSVETSTPSHSVREEGLVSVVCADKYSESIDCDVFKERDVNLRELQYQDSDISKDGSQVSAQLQCESSNLTNSSRRIASSIGEESSADSSFAIRNGEIPMNESSLGDFVSDTSAGSGITEESIVKSGIASSAEPLPSEGVIDNAACQIMNNTNSKTEYDKETAAYRAWKKSIMILWNQIASHRFASIFMHPVTDEIAPNYSSTVYRSVDLSSIKRDIENGTLRSTSEFQRDLMLMFQNALMYNNSDQHVYKMTSEMQSEVVDQVGQFLITQLMASQNHLNSMSGNGLVAEKAMTSNRQISASTNALLSVLVTESRPKRAAAIDMRKKQL